MPVPDDWIITWSYLDLSDYSIVYYETLNESIMSQEEVLVGNNEICKMLGWECFSLYHYKCPNLFPSSEDSGYTELRCDAIGFNSDWNMLIGAYNVALSKLNNSELVKNLLKRDEHFIANFGIKNFFGLFENQLHISSSWIKLVDFCKLYNAII